MNNDEVIKRIESLEKSLIEQKKYFENVIVNNTIHIQEIANNIEVKLDILCNLDRSGGSTKTGSKSSKSITKITYFKEKFKHNYNDFINNLYTEEELNNILNDEKVKSSKTEIQKKNKISELLYKFVSKDKEKDNIMKNMFEEYKKTLVNENEI